MNVSISHLIGTVALMSLFITAGLSYAIITSYIESDVYKQQLQQISENVALNLVEMMNLIKFAKYSSGYMIKAIDLPSDLGGRAYVVQLVNDTSQWGHVHAFLSTQKGLSADSTIPFNSEAGTEIQLFTNATVQHIQAGIDNTTIACSGTVYGGNEIVIWAQPIWNDENYSITIGIGWIQAT